VPSGNKGRSEVRQPKVVDDDQKRSDRTQTIQ